MFCPQCGAPNEDDSIFCGNCGAVLNPDEVPAQIEGQAEVEKAPGEAQAEAGLQDLGLPAPDAPSVQAPPPRPFPPPPGRPPRPATAAAALPTSGLAIASLLLGIGGLTILPLLGSILAIIFGYMARKDIRQRAGLVSGDGLAVAGIVLGWISIGLAVLGLLVGGAFAICGLCGAFGASN
jgi:hypothetical protein